MNPALRYSIERFADVEAFQISARGDKDYRTPDGIRVCRAIEYLEMLL